MELRRSAARLAAREDGFTIIESMAAAVILIIAVVLTITPLASSMRMIDRAKEITIAENLAQARIEEIRSLNYSDVGNPGYAPDGLLERIVTVDIEGRDYTITTDVQYVGNVTGLNVVPQGGDGVEGAFDPGVNYKYVTVIVSSSTGNVKPVRMDSIVAPPTLGALEDVAVVTVLIDPHQPYDAYPDPPPVLQLQGSASYLSTSNGLQQPFPDVTPGPYEIVLFTPNNWQLHPDTVATGANTVEAIGGWNSTRTIRVYQPASLSLDIEDELGAAITNATVQIVSQSSGSTIANLEGDYVFADLIPDRYTVTANAPGYVGVLAEVDVPGPGGGSSATATLVLSDAGGPGGTEVAVIFHVGYVDFAGWADYYIHGSLVNVVHPVLGEWEGTTDAAGNVTFNLPVNEGGFTATAETEHGHGPVTIEFDTTTTNASYDIALERPDSTDRIAISGGPPGPDGYFEYRIDTRRGFSNSWRQGQVSTLPSNDLGNATFLVPRSGFSTRRVTVWAFCSTGGPEDSVVYTLTQSEHTWFPSWSC
jgi:type II secretory pathway pseudopilin PulG